MRTDARRYRKYARKVDAANRRRKPGRDVEWLRLLKWRYWRRLHGDHAHLWGTPEPTGKAKR